jgi:cell division septum initiation protein DivIVA
MEDFIHVEGVDLFLNRLNKILEKLENQIETEKELDLRMKSLEQEILQLKKQNTEIINLINTLKDQLNQNTQNNQRTTDEMIQRLFNAHIRTRSIIGFVPSEKLHLGSISRLD